VLRAPECGAELALPTADLFGCALIRAPEQIRSIESLSGLQACGLSPLILRSAPHWHYSSKRLLYTSIGGTCKNTIGGTEWETL